MSKEVKVELRVRQLDTKLFSPDNNCELFIRFSKRMTFENNTLAEGFFDKYGVIKHPFNRARIVNL